MIKGELLVNYYFQYPHTRIRATLPDCLEYPPTKFANQPEYPPTQPKHSREVEDRSRYSALSVSINCQASSSVPPHGFALLRQPAWSIPPLVRRHPEYPPSRPEHSREVEEASRYSAFIVPHQLSSQLKCPPHLDLLTLRHLAPSIPPLGLQTN